MVYAQYHKMANSMKCQYMISTLLKLRQSYHTDAACIMHKNDELLRSMTTFLMQGIRIRNFLSIIIRSTTE